jgi:hypothetical protein
LEIAHAAVSRRPPISFYSIAARTEGYTYGVGVWDLSDIQAPFSVAPCQTLASRLATVASVCGRDATPRERAVGSAAAQEMRRRMAPFFLRREKASVLGRSGDDTEAAAVASAAPKVPSLGHKFDLIVWVKLTAPQRRLYLTFLSSASVRNALNKVKPLLPTRKVGVSTPCKERGMVSNARGSVPLVSLSGTLWGAWCRQGRRWRRSRS